MPITPKKYPVEVKDRAVRMVREHEGDYGSSTAACVAVGGHLGIARETLRRWLEQARADGDKPGVTTVESEEIKTLKKEKRRLREANESLRAASSFFAREPDPYHR